MSIRWVTSLLGLLLTVTIMVTAGLSWNVYSSFTKMVEADVQYLNLMQVSRELLQSSYDLTRKAREYVNTGDEASERAYYDILAQRSGRVPRKSSLAPGETISLPSLLERYGASRGDMEFLATALRRSDDLSITEIEAMQASKGEALCPDGLHSGSDTIDVEYARPFFLMPPTRNGLVRSSSLSSRGSPASLTGSPIKSKRTSVLSYTI